MSPPAGERRSQVSGARSRRAGSDRRQSARRPPRVLVCHPEALIAHAIAASLERSAGITRAIAVSSARDVVSRFNTRVAAALVSEALGAELAELVTALEYRGSALPVLVLVTRRPSDRGAAQLLELGAIGCVNEATSPDALQLAVITACAGGVVLPDYEPAVVLQALDDRRARRDTAVATLSGLKPRELQVLHSLVDGIVVADIARTLAVSPHTIRACVGRLGSILGVSGQNRVAAAGRQLLAAAHQPAANLARVRAQLAA